MEKKELITKITELQRDLAYEFIKSKNMENQFHKWFMKNHWKN